MKASEYVPLFLIGSVVAINTFGHRNDRDVTQQRYYSREECEVDWGAPENCNPDYSNSSGHSYLGPRYYWDRDIGKPVEVMSNGETKVLNNASLTSENSVRGQAVHVGTYSRGGFGNFSRGFSAGG